jgi:tRNA G18 (ribose-2'-O)-methylase SpoU
VGTLAQLARRLGTPLSEAPKAPRPHDPLGGSLQLTGPNEIAAAMDGGRRVELLLVLEGCDEPDVLALIERARALDLPVLSGSPNDLRRMSRRSPAASVLALAGRSPRGGLPEVLAAPGAVWLLAGARYPGNVGYVIRTAEVSGAVGVVVDVDFDRAERAQALRVCMGADRFMPVCWADAQAGFEAARKAGRRVVAIEDVGERAPWEVDLTGDVLLVVGGERDGIPRGLLASSDEIIRVPMAGFVPSYNLQGPVAVVAVERLRQMGSCGGPR